jgi:hypothetical protein
VEPDQQFFAGRKAIADISLPFEAGIRWQLVTTDFLAQYQTLDDDEILRLAADRESLVEEARPALDSELLRRKLTQESMGRYQADMKRAEMSQQLSNLNSLSYGTGKRLFGKRAYTSDPASKYDEFDNTLWIVVLWIPLVPIATFRIRRVKGLRPLGPWQSFPFIALNRSGRNWRMILSTWGWCLLSVVLVKVALTFLMKIRYW